MLLVCSVHLTFLPFFKFEPPEFWILDDWDYMLYITHTHAHARAHTHTHTD